MQPPYKKGSPSKNLERHTIWYGAPTEEFLLHTLLVALNHVFDHLATD